MNDKPSYTTFGEKKLEEAYELLHEGKFEDKKLYEFIGRAMTDLKIHNCGVKIPKQV